MLARAGVLAGGLAAVLAAEKPHIMYVLLDDYGWADAGWHRPENYTDVQTPRFKELAAEGVTLDRHYVYQFCSPTRSAVQSGRNPIHVNGINMDPSHSNPADPVSGYAAIPVNMTGMAQHMKAGGYQTHMAGKWDCGMATEFHTPRGRGYDTSLFYFHHANDYWTSKVAGYLDLSNGSGPAYGLPNPSDCSQKNQAEYCVYEDSHFFDHVHSKVVGWKEGDKPLFIFWAPHIVHGPLQVPNPYLQKFSEIKDSQRQLYHAMVYWIDEHVGKMADSIKAQGMWDDTLILLHADNGGPVSGGANNYPLKGGKFANWEGGIRVAAFASGGYLPAKVRGTKAEGFICGWDWYTTFAGLAGVDPTDHAAAKAGLPPVDGIDMWPYLSGAVAESPRDTIPVGNWIGGRTKGPIYVGGLIHQQHKILVGNYSEAGWTGPQHPNVTTHWDSGDTYMYCGNTSETGCLFDVFADPTEHNNLAASKPDMFNKLLAMLHTHDAGVFNPDRGDVNPAAAQMAKTTYHGFWGPFVTL